MMAPRASPSGLLISDFNTQNLAALLRNSEDAPSVEVREAPFGQVEQLLRDGKHDAWHPRPDFAVVWARPASVLPTFLAASKFQAADPAGLSNEVAAFGAAVTSLRDRVDRVLVPSWTVPRDRRGLGPIDYTHPLGLRRLLLEANRQLVEILADVPGVSVLDGEDWIRAAGESVNERLWYLAKIPYDNAVFKAAAREIKATLRAASGEARKLLVLDLDGVLWGGIVGEDGWEHLTLGGHDPDGEAFVDFQRGLQGLSNRGILLAIASKNEEATALEAIDRHPEMILSRSDFAAWRINWNDKARNVAEIADELNLGLQSVVFIDDTSAERARVQEALPEVLVPRWPPSPAKYPGSLASLTCFDSLAVTAEDRARGSLYQAERARRQARTEVASIEEWLATLETEVSVERLTTSDLARAAQLLNKTNQMNLATRRMAEVELERWAGEERNELWTFRVADRFGEHGLTGLLGLTPEGADLHMIDFVLSCRVMGRNVEKSMIAWAVSRARSLDLSRVRATYLPTTKNRPCLQVLEQSGLERDAQRHSFWWESATDYPLPEGVVLRGADAAPATHVP